MREGMERIKILASDVKDNAVLEFEKELYKFANECALKGIDIEDTFESVWNLTKEVIEAVNNLTNKNYDFLKKCLNHGSDDC